MPILLEELIEQLPSDTEDRVKKAKDRFNARIRDALRRETRLSFHRADETNVAVPIQIVPGVPVPLQPPDKQSIDDRHRVALLLAPFRHELTSMRDSGRKIVQELLPTLLRDSFARELLDGREQFIRGSAQYAEFLLQKLNEFELTKFILAVNTDVLGVYSYKVRGATYDEPEPRIELYWGVIGLVARDLGVAVEDLTCVVLTHELAHAYTHVGGDADDHWWASRNFFDAAHELKEGLAQFYTLLVCSRFDDSSTGALRAFWELLPHQPAAYLTHERWEQSTPEHVRLAMLATRRSENQSSLDSFEVHLRNARRQLQRGRGDAAAV